MIAPGTLLEAFSVPFPLWNAPVIQNSVLRKDTRSGIGFRISFLFKMEAIATRNAPRIDTKTIRVSRADKEWQNVFRFRRRERIERRTLQ